MKIAANDVRLVVQHDQCNDDQIMVTFDGVVEGDVLTIKGKNTNRVLRRVTETKFYGKNGKRVLLVVTK